MLTTRHPFAFCRVTFRAYIVTCPVAIGRSEPSANVSVHAQSLPSIPRSVQETIYHSPLSTVNVLHHPILLLLFPPIAQSERVTNSLEQPIKLSAPHPLPRTAVDYSARRVFERFLPYAGQESAPPSDKLGQST